MISVSLSRCCKQKLIGIIKRLWNYRDCICIDPAGKFSIHHFMEMSEKTKSCHICTGMYFVFPADCRSIFVQCCHGRNCLIHCLFGSFLHTVRRTDNSDAKFLCQDQLIPRLCRIVLVHMLRMNDTCHRKAVFHITVRDRVPACECSARLNDFFRAALHNCTKDIQIHLFRKAHDIQRRLYLSAHRIDIAQSIGSGNLSKRIGILYHRREKIQCLHNRYIVRYAVHCRIIPAVISYE